MDAVNLATIFVALIAAAGAFASQRASAKAAVQNTQVGGRVDMEKNAYDRARAFDTETIDRQNKEIVELRTAHETCDKKVDDLKERYEAEITMLRNRISRLERDTVANIEEILRERLKHNSDPDDASY